MKEKCRFCQNRDLKVFLKKKGRNLVECKNCGLVFVSPFPSENKIRAIYTKKAFKKFDPADKTEAGFGHYLAEEHLWKEFLKKKMTQIQRFKTEGKLLDVGCGIGTFLEEAKRARFKIYGVDIIDFAVEYCQQRGLKRVYKGTLTDSRFPSSSFDIVTVFHTLEHMWDPSAFLDEAKRILRFQGILMICVPDRKSLTARLMGKNWFDYYHYQHLFFFEEKTLINYLEKSGFRVLKRGKEGFNWVLAVRILSGMRCCYSSPVLDKLAQLVNDFLKFSKITRIPMLSGSMWIIAEKK